MTTEPQKKTVEKIKKETIKSRRMIIESYGVRVKIETDLDFLNFDEIENALAKQLPNEYKKNRSEGFEHSFFITKKKSVFALYKNTEKTGKTGKTEKAEKISENERFDALLEQLGSFIRVTVAEFAVGKVFLHAGVVGVNERAIILPARSFQGKTTLVAELVKNGATYYSDEYAVLDENGYVYPFPKSLSVRGIIDDFTQTDMPVEEFGGVAGTKPLPVALVLITAYKKNARWKPRELSPGQGIMEILPHTLPIRNKPEFTLNVLNNVAERAIITKTMRAEAKKTARLLISFFEKQAFKI